MVAGGVGTKRINISMVCVTAAQFKIHKAIHDLTQCTLMFDLRGRLQWTGASHLVRGKRAADIKVCAPRAAFFLRRKGNLNAFELRDLYY
jgi:hypothetical protein